MKEVDPSHPRPEKPKQELNMSKQILKTLTMLTLVVGFALAADVESAKGQSTIRVDADVPFDFIVAGKTLSSGKYRVDALTSGGECLRITSRDGKTSAIRLSNPIAENGERRTARLVFRRYGQKYFLAEVWSGGDYGRKLKECKMERVLRQELGAIASKSESLKPPYDIVEIVAVVH